MERQNSNGKSLRRSAEEVRLEMGHRFVFFFKFMEKGRIACQIRDRYRFCAEIVK